MTDEAEDNPKKKSSNYLAMEAMLHGDEKVITTMGAYIRLKSNTVNGVLALTNERLIFHGKYAFAKHSRSLNLAQITTIDLNGSMLGAHLVVTLAGASESFGCNHKAAQKFVAEVNAQLAEIRKQTQGAPASSAADELAKYAALHAQGILTDEEWATKKAQLL